MKAILKRFVNKNSLHVGWCNYFRSRCYVRQFFLRQFILIYFDSFLRQLLFPRRTKSESKITTFEGRRRAFLRFELSKNVQSNVAPALVILKTKNSFIFLLASRWPTNIQWLLLNKKMPVVWMSKFSFLNWNYEFPITNY